MSGELEKREYPAVDLFKFICCILIIAIHTKPFEQNFWLDGGVGILTRFAVPYFFVATGFFFFLSIDRKTDKRRYLIRYELRMLRLYVVWYIIQTVYSIIRGYVYHPLYYIRHFVWPNNGNILWFIPATMFAVFIVFEMSKVLMPKMVFVVSIGIWFIGYGLSTAAPLLTDIISGETIVGIQNTVGIQNGLFFGFPYIALAQLFAKSQKSENNVRDLIGIVASLCCLGLESLIVVLKVRPQLTFLWLSALPLAYFTFHFTLNIQIRERPLYILLRKISTLVYVVHPIMLKCVEDLFAHVGFIDYQNLALFFGVCMISVLVAFFIYQLSRRYKVFRYIM